MSLHLDIILCICKFLSEKETVRLSTTSKYFLTVPHNVWFDQPVQIKKIKNTTYFDRFRNVILCNTDTCVPKCAIRVVTDDFFNTSIERLMSPSVTHITFGHRFNQSVEGHIPASVTHLTFGYGFNQHIYDSIPDCVTHLTFGHCFSKQIRANVKRSTDESFERFIPNSVTHLVLGNGFNDFVDEGTIPPFVTHLTFGDGFCRPFYGKNCIPSSVTHLTFGSRFNQPIEGHVSPSVVYISFGYWFRQLINSLPDSVQQIHLSLNYNCLIDYRISQKVFYHVT